MKKMMLGFAALLPAGALFAQGTSEVKVQLDELKMQLEQLAPARIEAGSTFEFVSSTMVGGKSVKGAPYSAEAVNETTQVLADGNRIVRRNTTKLYRDGEGRERREESMSRPGSAQAEPARTVFITDPVANASYTLDTNKRTAHKMPMANRVYFNADTPGAGGVAGGMVLPRIAVATTGASAAHTMEIGDSTVTVHTGAATAVAGGRGGAMRTSSNQAPSKVEQLGKQMFDGVEAEGTRTTITIPAGQVGNERPIEIVSERWYSKDLQMTIMTKHSDPRSGETVYKLTNITRNEPLRSLFEVPPDYTSIEPQFRQRRDELQ